MEPNANIKLNKILPPISLEANVSELLLWLIFLKKQKNEYIHIHIAMPNDFQCKGRYWNCQEYRFR